MPVTSNGSAPYAPASAVISVVDRHRTKGLPTPVNAEVLARGGVSESLIPRTLYALQTLDLIDEAGKPTDTLEGLRLAPETEYKQRLAEWLHSAYADALQFIDPAKASETEIRDAFRSYTPVGQQSRMVSLFMGLFAAAGVRPERPAPTPRKSKDTSAAIKPTRTPKTPRASAQHNSTSNLPPALAGLMASLPPQGQGWTEDQRERFLATIGPVIDFCYPIIEPERKDNESEAEDSSGHER
ncbi:DUF5343 domain-containing protein [Pelagibius sp.]|uniref:DUF5343 domain-containing protein n=1 Tax=Pelagibius sp. TaxID=1931238 RepID=UPI00261DF2EA|nr:DUF5343 domain-containing protein [Pelagibius sp.]